MVLLRRVIGDALRARRQAQHRTLREVSTAANVSLGYLSEIERGQKEASSELLAAICVALGAALSEVLREVSDTMALAEEVQGVLVPVPERTADASQTAESGSTAATAPSVAGPKVTAADPKVAVTDPKVRVTDASVSVAVRRDGPLKTTLRATRKVGGAREREVVRAA